MIVKNFIDKYSQWISLVFWIVLVIFSVIEVDKVGFSNIWGFVLLSGSVGFGFNLALIIIQSRTIMNFYVDYDDEIQLGEGDEFHNFTCDEKIEFLLISILEIYSDSIYGDDLLVIYLIWLKMWWVSKKIIISTNTIFK